MVKITGACLVICAASLWGILAGAQVRNTYEQIQYLRKLIYQLRSEILYSHSYMGEAFLKIGEASVSPYREWMYGMYQEMEGKSKGGFFGIWENQTEVCLKKAGLPERVIEKLVMLGSRMGAADIGMQIKTLELFLEELDLISEEVQEEMKTKIRLCHCLGVTGGIFVAVLLI